jgi:S-adenosylmethionine hydrolase
MTISLVRTGPPDALLAAYTSGAVSGYNPRRPVLMKGRDEVPACRRLAALLLALLLSAPAMARDTNGMVVLETDFGLKDGAVAAMKGVALGVDRSLILHDLSHDIPPFDIWAGAYQLDITMPYWPKGTVFVAVIDPGVGTERGAVVARTGTGQYVVGPDNGLLTLVAEHYGIEAVRRIDEAKHRLPGSEKSYTFHGRDVFSYTAAKLAGGVITFEEVGPVLPGDVHRLAYTKAAFSGGTASGMVPSLDVNFGNVWTNIDRETFAGLDLKQGDKVAVRVLKEEQAVFEGTVPFVNTFGDVPEGEPLLYFNSEDRAALAINYGSFAGSHGIEAGPDWRVELRKP